jgi:succinoglycan biosynthesis transport protein ExoP
MSDDNRLAVASVRLEDGGAPVEQVRAIRNHLTPSTRPGAAGAGAAPAKDASPFAFLFMLHGALRGRYWWLVPLAVLFGGAFGAAAWKLFPAKYHSEALLRVAYSLPPVLPSSEREPMQIYELLMQNQRLLITSRRVIDQAVQDPIWSRTGTQVPAKPDDYFAQNLKVDIKPRSEFILITVTDDDPQTAATAATAIVNAYSELFKSQYTDAEGHRDRRLEDLQETVRTDLEDVNRQIAEKSQEYGTPKLETFYEMAAARVMKLESALADVRTAIAMAPVDGDADGAAADRHPADPASPAATQPALPAEPLTPEQIAKTDAVMRDYLSEEAAATRNLTQLRRRGFGPAHPALIAAQETLDEAKERIRKYAEMSREFKATTAQVLGDPVNGLVATAGKSLADLKANEASLVSLYKKAREELVALGNKRFELQPLAARAETLQMKAERLNDRLEELGAERLTAGRLSTISSPEIALTPDRNRRLPMAAAAAGAGMCLPVGLVLLLSFVKRKYRFSDDTHTDVSPQFPLLGILPELNRNADDVEQMAAAAHSIHQIRVSLQSQAPKDGASVYLVTSATAGEGKTSLAMSLGLSFAASRRRTLVIDCDLVGQRLTDNLQASEVEGLHEALATGSLKRLVRKTKDGVFVLPAGRAAAHHGCAVPPATLAALFAEARRYFDVTIVDSGPILGSVEAAVVAREVDGVVFAIARGQEQGLVLKAVQRLESLGGRLAGCVFNRANRSDFDRLPYGSSWSSAPAKVNANSSNRLERFGPLVQAVAGTVPSTHN